MPPASANEKRFRLAPLAEPLGLIGVLFGLIVIFSFLNDRFLSQATFNQLANQVPALAVIAIGTTFVIISAGIDLSVGSVMAFSGAVLGLAMVHWGLPLAAAIPLAILAGTICGWVNGWITVQFKVPGFIVTLGMMQIARGLAYLATDSQTLYIGKPIEWFGAPLPFAGLSPAFFLAVLLVILGQFVLHRTVFGRYVRVIGANEEAAIYSGIRTGPIKVGVYLIAGSLAGLAALFDGSKIQSIDPNAGVGMELSAIAAAVIGGTSLMGGRGSIIGTFIGVLIIATLGAGLAQIGTSEPVKLLVTGIVIVAAVIIDVWRNRHHSLRKSS
jgi:ribose transport system permease protein